MSSFIFLLGNSSNYLKNMTTNEWKELLKIDTTRDFYFDSFLLSFFPFIR